MKTTIQNRIILLAAVVTLSSCSSVPLTAQEQAVRLLRKSDAPANCKEMGKVTAPGLASLSEQGREDDLERAAHKAGGNTVTMDRRDENNTIYGTAFTYN